MQENFIEKDDVGNIYFSDFTGLVRYSYMDSNAMLDSGLAAAKLHADAEANVIGYSGGDHAGRVTQNVVFAANGVNGSIISWESDHPEYISNSGVVVRPAPNAGNVTVDIRATFELNGLEQKKLFRLTVIAEEAGNGNGNNGGNNGNNGNNGNEGGSTSPENPVQQDNDQIKVSFKGTYVDIKADDLIELLEGKSKILVASNSEAAFEFSLSESQIKVLAPFTDTESLSWSAPYLAAALQDQIVQGKPGNRLDPKGVLTRAEMVVMLKRFLTKVSYVSE
ncbi:S-layer homology domain-containing protein [Paenibacillus sp. IITD108]|uniref:S-layer homology domain-containing protein n=1 Tax=Paenibacillus sp. IITD108 TaxID=3116649 RepID=UPI002F3EF2C2